MVLGIGPRAGVAGFAVASIAVLVPHSASAQSTAPSSIAPPSGRTATNPESPGVDLPPTDGLQPPAGAETLTVTVTAIEVEDGNPKLKRESDAILAGYIGRKVTLADLYAAATAIEQLYARNGYVLTRIVVPPQKVDDNGVFRIRILNGFIEGVDVDASLGRARGAVAGRLDALVRHPGLTLDAIERPILMAGDVPGVSITSTLSRGSGVGAARLTIGGTYRPVTGSVTVDNGIASSLGGGSVAAQLSLNSILGHGEQIYGFAILPVELSRAFDGDAPLRVFGAGMLLPTRDGRFTVNPEVTIARTQPKAVAGAPRTVGRLRRLSLGGSYALSRLRRFTASLTASLEGIEESNEAIDFGVDISRDRFLVGRLGANLLVRRPNGGVIAGSLRLSQGLDGTRAASLPAGTGPSRLGATPGFTALSATLRFAEPLPRSFELRVTAKGQTSFGDPLFRSEQAATEGPDALSAYVGGTTAVDAMIVTRTELIRPLLRATAERPFTIEPYVFAAAGFGRLERPTTVERRSIGLANAGGGIRGRIGARALSYGIEYAHAFDSSGFAARDRVSLTATLAF